MDRERLYVVCFIRVIVRVIVGVFVRYLVSVFVILLFLFIFGVGSSYCSYEGSCRFL